MDGWLLLIYESGDSAAPFQGSPFVETQLKATVTSEGPKEFDFEVLSQ